MNKLEAKVAVKKLVERYQGNRRNYIDPKYNETLLRSDFLDPLFEALGWDIKNDKGKPTNEREVILEEGLKDNVAENSKKPDYTFRLFAERKFFLEAKKPSVDISKNQDTAKQIRRYGFTAKLKISVLSNFEYLAIYDCSEKVKETDQSRTSLVKLYHFSEYEKYFDEIYDYLSKDVVYSGNFDKTWSYIEDKINRFSVDDLFLEQINEWRFLLGNEIYKHQNDINEQTLNDIVQSYLNSVIFLRVCEDRNLENYKTLLSFATKNDFRALINKFVEADRKYNSGLFDHPLREKIISDNQSIFWEIIRKLYYPESPYSFSVFSSDIIGSIYEIYLSQKLYIKNGTVVLENKPEHVDRDIITTPTNIIQDILRNTLIPFIQNKNDGEILKTKVADISCGSGAFLSEAFQLLNDVLIDFYLRVDRSKLIQTAINTYKLPYEIKKQILLNCIHGVDKDFNAVQACKFGLLLKLLESESNGSIDKKVSILPSLGKNIFFGNSLLNFDQSTKKDQLEINPYTFSYKFDVIIGNPPYMKSEDMKNITPKELPLYKKFYQTAYKQFDKYFLFIEKGLMLLNNGGYLGYIVPSKFIKVGAGRKLRELLRKSKNISQLISFGANQVFKDKTTYTCLLFLHKEVNEFFKYFEVEDFDDWRTRDFSDTDFEEINTTTLSNDVWALVPASLRNIYKKINQKSLSLGELIGEESIFNGIQTSANKIYIHRPKKEDKNYYYFDKDGLEWKIEKMVTRPYFETSNGIDNLYTYRKFEPNSFVIYPYKKTNKGIEFIEIKEMERRFPFAYKYLLQHKIELMKRDIKPEPMTSNEWYRYGRHQSLDKCEIPAKIVVGILSMGDKYAVDYNQTVLSSGGNAGYCIISIPENFEYSIYYIQALLNSKYLEWYCSLIGSVFRGGYISHGTQVLKKLPIIKINFDNKEERNLHDQISKLQKELIEIQDEIDKNESNSRLKIPLQRKFNNSKGILKKLLKELFQLGKDDDLVPLVSKKYEVN